MNVSFEEELDGLIKKRIREISLQRGWLRWLGGRIRGWFFKGPRAEIAHDWLAVNEFAERAARDLAKETQVPECKKHKLASVLAYLRCARTEHDFAQAWTYVNAADALLPLVVSDAEVKACTVRFRAQDGRMPDGFRKLLEETIGPGPESIGQGIVGLLSDKAHRTKAVEMLMQLGSAASPAITPLKKLLEDKDPGFHKLVIEALANICPSAASPATSVVTGSSLPDYGERCRLHAEQLVRALIWNMLNRRISLKISLWHSLQRRLGCALLAPVFAAALWFGSHPSSGIAVDSWAMRQFIAIALLGFFGGTLSALLKAREMAVNIPSYEAIKTHTTLRMLLGAAGALVVYIVGQWLLADELLKRIQENLFVFMSVGIAAGFSERLFVEALEKVALNLRLTGTSKETGDEEEPISGAPKS